MNWDSRRQRHILIWDETASDDDDARIAIGMRAAEIGQYPTTWNMSERMWRREEQRVTACRVENIRRCAYFIWHCHCQLVGNGV